MTKKIIGAPSFIFHIVLSNDKKSILERESRISREIHHRFPLKLQYFKVEVQGRLKVEKLKKKKNENTTNVEVFIYNSKYTLFTILISPKHFPL